MGFGPQGKISYLNFSLIHFNSVLSVVILSIFLTLFHKNSLMIGSGYVDCSLTLGGFTFCKLTRGRHFLFRVPWPSWVNMQEEELKNKSQSAPSDPPQPPLRDKKTKNKKTRFDLVSVCMFLAGSDNLLLFIKYV